MRRLPLVLALAAAAALLATINVTLKNAYVTDKAYIVIQDVQNGVMTYSGWVHLPVNLTIPPGSIAYIKLERGSYIVKNAPLGSLGLDMPCNWTARHIMYHGGVGGDVIGVNITVYATTPLMSLAGPEANGTWVYIAVQRDIKPPYQYPECAGLLVR